MGKFGIIWVVVVIFWIGLIVWILRVVFVIGNCVGCYDDIGRNFKIGIWVELFDGVGCIWKRYVGNCYFGVE